MTLREAPQFLQTRLLAVLQAALSAPGNWARFHKAGLIQENASTPESPTLVKNWQDQFAELPLLEKATVRHHPGRYLAGVDDIVYRGTTSGSRSRSYTFFAHTTWNQRRLQSRQDFLAWWGIDQHTPVVNVASRLMPGREGDWAIIGPVNQAFIKSLLTLLESQHSVLRGYPSRLCEVASVLRPPLPPVKAVICTGEPLFQYQRELLTSVFRASVVNEYGCHEAAVRGFACPEFGRIHLDEQSCFFEIIDRSLVTTDLWNEVMPLVRYQCGDCVRPFTTPCRCGRPGLTVQVLGRVEDRIGTLQGVKLPGEVDLPVLSSILHYRIQRQSPTLVSAQIQIKELPNETSTPRPKPALQTWVNKTFGHSQLSITHHSALADRKRGEPEAWSDRQWLNTITQNSLSAWLTTAEMPIGEAQSSAKVLKSLLTPHVVGADLPQPIQQQITALAKSVVAAEPAVETMKVRILLLACSCMRDRQTSQAIYSQAVGRQQSLPTALQSALQLDVLIPTLHLSSEVATSAWKTVAIADTWQLDPLHVQHLLAAFELALQRRSPAERPPALRQLQPPLAVLIGDLSFWAADLTLAHLHHWAELLQGAPVASALPPQPSEASAFAAAWLQWRQTLIRNPQTAANTFEALQPAAVSATEKARLQIEQGYLDIVRKVPLYPQKWLPIIETYMADLTATMTSPADLTPWLPIVKALVKPLHQQGQAELAYRCLLAVSTPSRQQSAFERLTAQFNQKQSVLIDLCSQQQASL